jgi:uncharacterized protein YggE
MNNNDVRLKNLTIVAFLIFLSIVIIYSLFFGPIKKFSDSLMPVRTIMVSADGKVIVSPDMAKISFAVVSEGVDLKIISQENIKNINTAIDYLKTKGIEEKDIKTTQYNLSPKYEYDEKTRKTFISGYTLTQNVLVKIRDLNKVAEVISGLTEVGINRIDSISFEIDEPEKYLAEARNQAFEKAKKKAEEMALKNSVKLGKVINFSEWEPTTRPYDNLKTLGMGGEGGVAAPSVLPKIQPGSEEITINVSVTYEIK